MSKPTLGYPTRTAAVVALRKQGLSTAQIAERISIEKKTVAALEASAERSKAASQANRTVLVPADILDRLLPHATRRHVSTNELARQLLEACVDDNMIDAVLDDGAAQ